MLRISYLVELNCLMPLCIISISTLNLDWLDEQDRSKPDTSGSLINPLHLGFQSLAPLPSPWEQTQAGAWRMREESSGAESAQLSHLKPQTCLREPNQDQQNQLASHRLASKNICFLYTKNFWWFDTQHYCSRDNWSIPQIT